MSTSERRAGRTSSRDRLLDAAAGVASQGIQNLTIEAVAAAAKVTKAGLVYHFKTRDDLLAALIERVVGELDMLDLRAQEARDAREADDSAKPLKSSMAELSKLTFDMPEDRRLLLANLLAATSLYPHLAGPCGISSRAAMHGLRKAAPMQGRCSRWSSPSTASPCSKCSTCTGSRPSSAKCCATRWKARFASFPEPSFISKV